MEIFISFPKRYTFYCHNQCKNISTLIFFRTSNRH
nr:MAG TPA: hypothetical protein [Caudoviricetes sp.]